MEGFFLLLLFLILWLVDRLLDAGVRFLAKVRSVAKALASAGVAAELRPSERVGTQ